MSLLKFSLASILIDSKLLHGFILGSYTTANPLLVRPWLYNTTWHETDQQLQ
jgi:hypothetical protein